LGYIPDVLMFIAHNRETFLSKAILQASTEQTQEERAHISQSYSVVLAHARSFNLFVFLTGEFESKRKEREASVEEVLKRKNEEAREGLCGVVRDVDVILGEWEIVREGRLV
jgi:hypothetical protein